MYFHEEKHLSRKQIQKPKMILIKLSKRILCDKYFIVLESKIKCLQILSESVSCSVMSCSLRPLGLQPARLLCPWNSSGKNTGVGCHSLLQRIFLTQGSNLGLLHHKQILYHLSHQESPSMATMPIHQIFRLICPGFQLELTACLIRPSSF